MNGVLEISCVSCAYTMCRTLLLKSLSFSSGNAAPTVNTFQEEAWHIPLPVLLHCAVKRVTFEQR